MQETGCDSAGWREVILNVMGFQPTVICTLEKSQGGRTATIVNSVFPNHVGIAAVRVVHCVLRLAVN